MSKWVGLNEHFSYHVYLTLGKKTSYMPLDIEYTLGETFIFIQCKKIPNSLAFLQYQNEKVPVEKQPSLILTPVSSTGLHT